MIVISVTIKPIHNVVMYDCDRIFPVSLQFDI